MFTISDNRRWKWKTRFVVADFLDFYRKRKDVMNYCQWAKKTWY